MTGYDDEHRDLVALYAMDALDDLDRVRAERVVANSPEASGEFARYTDALAAMVDRTTAVEPPASAWEAISARVRAGSTMTAASASASIAPAAATDDPASTMVVAGATPAGATVLAPRRSWLANGRILAVAAALVVVVLSAVTVRSLTRSSASDRSRMEAALALPTTHTGVLGGGATVALQADGTGWIDVAPLPDPGPGNVYQLWSLDSGSPVSLGVVKPSHGVARFSAPAASHTLAVSTEKAPGATSPTLQSVVAVELN